MVIYNPVEGLNTLDYEEGIESMQAKISTQEIMFFYIALDDHNNLDHYLKRLQRCQAKSILEAKIGGYRLYDADIITLINESGWVADHVSIIRTLV